MWVGETGTMRRHRSVVSISPQLSDRREKLLETRKSSAGTKEKLVAISGVDTFPWTKGKQ